MGFNGFLWVQTSLSEKSVGAAAPTAPTLTRPLTLKDLTSSNMMTSGLGKVRLRLLLVDEATLEV